MKLTVKKNVFRDILSKVQGLTNRRTNLAITETIVIQAVDSFCTISATDMETSYFGFFAASIEVRGEIAINSKKLFEIVRDFPAEEILINEVENRWIEIGCENIEYHIVGMDSETFPEVPAIKNTEHIEIDSASLKKMIKKTIVIAGSSEDNRPHLHGIWFERIADEDEKIVRMVSTDGSRLSKVDYVFDPDYDLSSGPGILIPKKGLHEVVKFLESEGLVRIGHTENHFFVKKETETLTIRLLEGDFPKYADILVKGDGNVVEADRQMFVGMLKRMSILASDEYKGVIFNFDDDKLVVTTTNPEIGESKEELGLGFDGERIEVAFNPKYFIETLNAVEGDTAVIHITGKSKPCLIEGRGDRSYISVIMPMSNG